MRKVLAYVREIVKPYMRKEAFRYILAPNEEILPISLVGIAELGYGIAIATKNPNRAVIEVPIFLAASTFGIYLAASARRALKYRFPRLFGMRYSTVTGKKLERGDTLF